jgi:hypothetical protein
MWRREGLREYTIRFGRDSNEFLSPEHPNTVNPIADMRATLQQGKVLLAASLSTVLQISQEIIDKVGRAELSNAFQVAIGAKT